MRPCCWRKRARNINHRCWRTGTILVWQHDTILLILATVDKKTKGQPLTREVKSYVSIIHPEKRKTRSLIVVVVQSWFGSIAFWVRWKWCNPVHRWSPMICQHELIIYFPSTSSTSPSILSTTTTFMYDTISFCFMFIYGGSDLILWTSIDNSDRPQLITTTVMTHRWHHSGWVWVRTRGDFQMNNSIWQGTLLALALALITWKHSLWGRHSPRPRHRTKHTYLVADGFIVVQDC